MQKVQIMTKGINANYQFASDKTKKLSKSYSKIYSAFELSSVRNEIGMKVSKIFRSLL